jgi:hypothetical protein
MYALAVGPVFFPLDKAWGLDASVYSPELKRQLVWLSGLLPYAQAEAVMARIGKRTISDSSLWRTVERQGHRLTAETEPTKRVMAAPAGSDQPWDWGKMLSMDGGMVNIRQEGWKELKVGLIGHVVSDDPPDSSVIPEVHTVPLVYTAVLGDVEAFAPMLERAAQAHGFFEARQSSIPADGATWIWGVVDRYFPQSVQIVDWYHAAEHLADAAHARFPDQPKPAAAWLQTQREVLFEGPLDSLLADLNQAGLSEFAHYFETHHARMRYLDFQEAGFPIGSGSVESEVKQFKQRLTASGMHWSRPGAERMIPIRAAVLDNSFDARWANAA